MNKSVMAAIFLFTLSFSLFGEMVYVYIEETCNGEHVEFLPKARSGIFDALFEAGHIVFDNSTDKAETDLITQKKLSPVLAQAAAGGADYLICVAIASTSQVLPNKRLRLSSTGTYFLYEARSGKLIATGNAVIDNSGREEAMPPAECGLSLGKQIGMALGQILGSH